MVGEKTGKNQSILRMPGSLIKTHASYGNRTHVNSLEGCYATTTPTMLGTSGHNGNVIDERPKNTMSSRIEH